MSIHVECGECFDTYDVPEKYAGRKIKCKACGGAIRVPRPGEELADDLEFAEEPVSRRSAPPPQRRKSKGKSRRRKSSASGFPTGLPLMIGGALLLSLFVLSFFASPVRMVLLFVFVLGGIGFYLLGWARTLVTAFQEGAAQGIICFLFFPFFSLFALFTDWSTYSRPVFTTLLGVCLLAGAWPQGMLMKMGGIQGMAGDDDIVQLEQNLEAQAEQQPFQPPPGANPAQGDIPVGGANPGRMNPGGFPDQSSPRGTPSAPNGSSAAGPGTPPRARTFPPNGLNEEDRWTRGTKPLPADAELTEGQYVMVQEGGVKWTPAEILEVTGPDRAKIHYYGWSANFDEVVPRSQIRLPHQAGDVPESELVTVEYQIVRYKPRGKETLEALLRSRLGYIADSVTISDDKTDVSIRAIRGSSAERSAHIAFSRVGIIVR